MDVNVQSFMVPFDAASSSSELLSSFPLGNPDHPTGSAVQVRRTHGVRVISSRSIVVGVCRGDTWQCEATFTLSQRDQAEVFAEGLRLGMGWRPRP